MIKVKLPNSFLPERKYIIDVFLSEFLGLEYTLDIGEYSNYQFVLPNGNELIVYDKFFSNQKENKYISAKNIPDAPRFASNEFTIEQDIPVLYGSDKLLLNSQKIDCHNDIFASSFFLLTRWEESIGNYRDKHLRFDSKMSYMQEHNLHYRPIVDEYLEMFWNFLKYLGCEQDRKPREFLIKPTHDIDNLFRYITPIKSFRALLGDLIKRKSLKRAKNTIVEYRMLRKGKVKDPYDKFDELMDLSEAAGVKSAFYFMPGILGENDVRYSILSKDVKDRMEKIRSRGHVVGMHAGIDTFNKAEKLKIEYDRINKLFDDENIIEGRQHFLKFQVPLTWELLANLGMKRDLSMCYENDGGFRCGIAREYPVYDVFARKQLSIREQPTIVMELALQRASSGVPEFEQKFIELKKIVEKYKGQFVFLWHPDNFEKAEWENYKSVYSKILKNE